MNERAYSENNSNTMAIRGITERKQEGNKKKSTIEIVEETPEKNTLKMRPMYQLRYWLEASCTLNISLKHHW
jgi:hypothetical protein